MKTGLIITATFLLIIGLFLLAVRLFFSLSIQGLGFAKYHFWYCFIFPWFEKNRVVL